MPKVVDADKMRAQILEAAQRVFEKKGLYAARMSDIATEMKIVKGTLYRYFESKDAVVTGLVKHQIVQMKDAYDQGADDVRSTQDLLARLTLVLKVGREAAPTIRFFFEVLQAGLALGSVREELKEFFARLGAEISEGLMMLYPDLEPTKAYSHGRAMSAMLDGIVIQNALLRLDEVEWNAIVQASIEQFEMLFNGFALTSDQ